MTRLRMSACLGILLLCAAAAASELPPCYPGSGEAYNYKVEVSIDGGYNWHSDSIMIFAYPGEQVDIGVRVLLTCMMGETQAWSYGLAHDATNLKSLGGDLTLNGVTTDGTHTATVKNGGPPDMDETAVMDASVGFTQAVLIDTTQAVTLAPVVGFVTAGACYTLTVPYYSCDGYENCVATIALTGGIGSPAVSAVMTQAGQSKFPCAKDFTIHVAYGSSSYAWCDLYYNSWTSGSQMRSPGVLETTLAMGGAPPKDDPPPPRDGLLLPPYSCAETNGDGFLDISDPVYLLSHLFLGGDPPPTVNTMMVLRTGQSLCYDNDGLTLMTCSDADYPGEDGYYQLGRQRGYQEMLSEQGVTVVDLSTGLEWQKSPPQELYSWAEARAAAAALELGPAGVEYPWRLPTLGEILTVMDYSRSFPAADPIFGLSSDHGALWTTTTYAPESVKAWYVRPVTGATLSEAKANRLYFMAVRNRRPDVPARHEGATLVPPSAQYQLGDSNGDALINLSDAVYTLNFLFQGGPAPPRIVGRPVLPETIEAGRFVDNGDLTVTDALTGLMWRREPLYRINENVDWNDPVLQEAWNMAFPLPGPGTYYDWRVPNVFELMTVIDLSKSQGVVLAEPFSPDPSLVDRPLWTSTTATDESGGGSAYAWTLPYHVDLEAEEAGSLKGLEYLPAYKMFQYNTVGYLAVRGFADE
ncbi:MAG: DUF1566 domain-containing protein [Planctomycetes bacterium]|nr:DUF1566 domain-containing protein [Planctomycetota bacterium]